GLPKDPETGFVYARNRYYDPEMGRFVSADPLGYVDGGNLYQYGLNDPVNGSDPLGVCVPAFPRPPALRGFVERIGEMAISVVQAPARAFEESAERKQERMDALAAGGGPAYEEELARHAEGQKVFAKSLFPGVSSGRAIGEAIEACSNGSGYEC